MRSVTLTVLPDRGPVISTVRGDVSPLPCVLIEQVADGAEVSFPEIGPLRVRFCDTGPGGDAAVGVPPEQAASEASSVAAPVILAA